VFLGASYFRATDRNSQFGISCRGLAIDTGLPRPEEFPVFSAFWIERPRPTDTVLTVHALLESDSLTGAYRFGVAPGGATVMDVTAHLFPRRPVERLGIAPLTSMYQFGENDRRVSTTGAARSTIPTGSRCGAATASGYGGRWSTRRRSGCPGSATRTRAASACSSATGTSATTRTRVRATSAARRSGSSRSSRSGRGGVHLVEIPTGDETADNVVAFWTPEAPLKPGREVELAYRLHWAPEPPVRPTIGACVATRVGRGGIIGHGAAASCASSWSTSPAATCRWSPRAPWSSR
jgi:glucans biosynthesis protein